MIETAVTLDIQPLQVTLKSKFRHAGATRHEGESIWVVASRKGLSGYGEGCPRDYVAGDDLTSSVIWARDYFQEGHDALACLSSMELWAQENCQLIDTYPSAWCAIEMALLDLFAREHGMGVEDLLHLGKIQRKGSYTAVLGDDHTWRYTYLTDQYLVRDMRDFKIKLNGRLDKDQKKINILLKLAKEYGIDDLRIRLDANNLWAGETDAAIAHIKALTGSFFAVEEPVKARDAKEISRFSVETGLPVILDESLLTPKDLDTYQDLPGSFIANIKISRVGGLMRTLSLIQALKKKGWPIIIGCHVGESSLLTRAGLIASGAAGDNLTAHEGAFGDYLVEWEPVKPMLRFGSSGKLDLDGLYYYKTSMGLQLVPAETWNLGMGMDGRSPCPPPDGDPLIQSLTMPDGYDIHYRVWGKTKGDDVLFVLHGGMSHSAWQAPLAAAMHAISPSVTVMAPDRRGCGLNDKRGDLGTVSQVTSDVTEHILFLKKHFKRVHVAGWCQGCQYAAIAAARLPMDVDTLILLTPGFFWNERFRSVLTIAEKVVLKMINEFSLKPDRDHACVPIPMEGTDFTLNDTWLDFIENDKLKTTMITMKSASVMDEVQELSWVSIADIRQPMLMVMADKDRIVDNAKVLQFMGARFTEKGVNRLTHVNCGHAIQFEDPGTIAKEITMFIEQKAEEKIKKTSEETEVLNA
ncbi:MAG: alpha/beta fold hydrolase [Proteobacteria bacterium]|nr:alpha/beta fold hydrolase [Pseudomonadota bacterium]